MEINKIHNQECIEGIEEKILDISIDLILCDLPYGTTQNKWDSIISLDLLWKQYKRIIKPNGIIVLTAQMPFTFTLGMSNLEWFRYEWIWEKEQGTGFLNANKAPLKSHENILVFSPSGTHTYNPQMEVGKPYSQKAGRKSSNYGDYVPVITTSEKRYPKTVLNFNKDRKIIHPTQKPVKLFEYLIKTYTNENDLVLDNCMGSGTTAVACVNTNRNFIGFELDLNYYQQSLERLSKSENKKLKNQNLFDLFDF